jgi:hypothetical protein
MKQIGMFTSMFPGKTQSEEFREAAEKDKHRKQIVNAAGKGDEKKLQLLLTKYSGINLNEKVPASHLSQFRLCVPYSTSLRFTQKPFLLLWISKRITWLCRSMYVAAPPPYFFF